MPESKFIGVDGCPFGWFSIGIDLSGDWEACKFRQFSDLLAYYSEADLILVDIPIGLPEGSGGRDCDREVRGLLGRPRQSSVFPVPTRQTVEYAAQYPSDYRGGVGVESQFAGKGISKQAFAIAPKIAQVDKVMRERGTASKPRVREVHPELCFWVLNNKKPMVYSKKARERKGEKERLDVIRGILPRVQEIFDSVCDTYSRKEVAKDDILDALVAATIARHRQNEIQSIPEDPPRDSKDIPMEIVF